MWRCGHASARAESPAADSRVQFSKLSDRSSFSCDSSAKAQDAIAASDSLSNAPALEIVMLVARENRADTCHLETGP